MNGTIAAVDTDHGNQMKDDSINQEQQPRTHFLGHKQIRGGGGVIREVKWKKCKLQKQEGAKVVSCNTSVPCVKKDHVHEGQ